MQALARDAPVPEPALLRSIAPQLLALAVKYNLQFLRFLAEEYDDYPDSLKPFKASQVIQPNAEAEATKYFINNGIEPLSGDLAGYVQTNLVIENLEANPTLLSALWLQAAQITDSVKQRDTFAALKTKSDDLEGRNDGAALKLQWQTDLREKLKLSAQRRRVTDVFNTLALLKENDVELAPTEVTEEWGKIILDEHVPLPKLKGLGFVFSNRGIRGLDPLYAAAREAVDSKENYKALKLVFDAPVFRYVMKASTESGGNWTHVLTSDDDWYWALEMTLIIEGDADTLWNIGKSPVGAIVTDVMGTP